MMRPWAIWLKNHRMMWLVWAVWILGVPPAIVIYTIYGGVVGFVDNAKEVPDMIKYDIESMKE